MILRNVVEIKQQDSIESTGCILELILTRMNMLTQVARKITSN